MASFSFTASEADARLACALDGAPFTLCSSPESYAQLAQGKHSFMVRAKDRAGNLGPVASYSWTIDTTPPTTAITSKPTDPATSGSASFTFSASEPGSQFACALDGSAFAPCSSPQGYTGLGVGRHTFAVRATDAAGNSGPAASYSWTISTPMPDLVISKVSSASFTVSNIGKGTAGPFLVTVSGVGTFSFRGLAAGASATRTLPCSESTRAVTIDPQNQVAESNESNNTAKIPASVC